MHLMLPYGVAMTAGNGIRCYLNFDPEAKAHELDYTRHAGEAGVNIVFNTGELTRLEVRNMTVKDWQNEPRALAGTVPRPVLADWSRRVHERRHECGPDVLLTELKAELQAAVVAIAAQHEGKTCS